MTSSHPASLIFSVVCLSLLPQLGARCFPTYRLLSKASGPSGPTKLNRGFRNCLTHTRTCTQVCRILEMISKAGICCLLRPDLPLRWPCWPAPLSMPLCLSLCKPASPSPSSQHPVCAPLFPVTPAFPPPTALHCPTVTTSYSFGPLRRMFTNLKNTQSLLQLLIFAIIALRQAKRIHQQIAVTISQ